MLDGDIIGIEATGNQLKFTEIVISRFEDEKIVKKWEVPDQLMILEQLSDISRSP